MMKQRSQLALILIVLVIFCEGCMTQGLALTNTPCVNSVEMNKSTMLSPNEGTLLFGHIFREGMVGNAPIHDTEFIQLDPKYEPAYYSPGKVGSMFYLAPVKPGITAHLIRWNYTSGNTIHIGLPGLQKSNITITIRADKPGLQYVGAYQFINPSVETNAITNEYLAFHLVDSPSELDALRELLPLLANTAWEAEITKRIKELEK
ncbi:MAG TPA: hypothetical protein PLU93_07115 [Treponemataceae bacterium]|nr:hypothetical protein [Treponemataceae bacterium]